MTRTGSYWALLIAAACALSLSACGSASHDPQAAAHAGTVVTIVKHARKHHASHRHRHKPSAPSEQAPAPAPAPTFTACDSNITVRTATTSCAFAQNVFFEYWAGSGDAISAYSPTTRATYELDCNGVSRIACTTTGGAEVRFSQSAVDAYTDDQAEAYASRTDLGPESSYVAPDEETDDAPSYDDPYEDPDHAPPLDDSSDDFCDTHDCIPNYDDGNGYTVQCADGSYSQSGGIQGACSGHGGVR